MKKLLELSLDEAGKWSEHGQMRFPVTRVQETGLRGQGVSFGSLTENLEEAWGQEAANSILSPSLI